MTSLSDKQREQLEKEIFAGRKIGAIKLYRQFTGSGLVEAKRAVDDLEVDLRRQSPERFVGGAQKSGCFGMVMMAVIVVVLVVLGFYLRRNALSSRHSSS